MITEREWVARCCNLYQNERDSIQQLLSSFERISDSFSREDHDRMVTISKVLKPLPSFQGVFSSISSQVSSLRPKDRGFKSRLEKLENEITALRVQSVADEEKLSGNIKRLQEDISLREKRQFARQTPAIRPVIQDIQFESPISEFQEYVAKNGGFTGGWDSESHAEFVRLYSRHGSQENFVDFMPNTPPEAIRAHIEWYEKFLQLKQRMKAVLQEQREKSRQAANSKSPSSPKVDPEIVKQRIAERIRLKEEKQRQEAEMEEKRRAAILDKRRQKFQELKSKLETRPKAKPKPISEQKPDPRRSRKSGAFRQEDWERIQQRDQEVLMRKQQILQQQEEMRLEREEKERKLAEINARKYRHIQRDPERLMKPTAAILAKKRTDDNEPKGPVNSVFEIPHRAVPVWMQ